MKFICYRKDLQDALQFLMKAVAVKPMTPILSGIYLKAEGAILELHSNNYSTGIIAEVPANIEATGEVVVNGKLFQDFVRSISGEMLTLSDENSNATLSIKTDNAGVELMMMDPQEFPKVKKPDPVGTFNLRASLLRRLISKTIFAAAKDESRPVFTGCCLEIKDDILTLVATNTHRIAIARQELQNHVEDCSFIVPAESLRSIMFRIHPNEPDCEMIISYSQRYLTFMFENVYVSARLIEGQFPPYDRVIPKSSTTQVNVRTDKFKSAVEFIALMSKETEFNTIKLGFHDYKVELSSNSPEVGDAVNTVEVEHFGDDLDISFNVDYILDVLKVVEGDYVRIELSDKYSPAAFTDLKDNTYIYVATPVRT